MLSPQAGPLFEGQAAPVTGCIYVAKTLSDDPALADLTHHMVKIGSTTGSPAGRVSTAENDPTFLMAKAEIIAEYDTRGVAPKKIEGLLHRFFAGACINVRLPDRFGRSVDPREWFFVSPATVEHAVRLIATRSLHLYSYDLDKDQVRSRTSG